MRHSPPQGESAAGCCLFGSAPGAGSRGTIPGSVWLDHGLSGWCRSAARAQSALQDGRELLDAVARRRNFAIISHPDAGKTTLTEKLLLYGGAIQQAAPEARANNAKSHLTGWSCRNSAGSPSPPPFSSSITPATRSICLTLRVTRTFQKIRIDLPLRQCCDARRWGLARASDPNSLSVGCGRSHFHVHQQDGLTRS